jgi:uncharacterized protein YecE (DUF72 family)
MSYRSYRDERANFAFKIKVANFLIGTADVLAPGFLLHRLRKVQLVSCRPDFIISRSRVSNSAFLVLNGGLKFHVGTSGYSYKEWKGKFYPKDFSPDQMLPYYAEHFSAVEINNTFYRMPKASVLEAWTGQVPGDFKFALKAPQRITHFQRLKDAGNTVSDFLRITAVLRDRLGPLLFGLPPNFKKDVPRLREFLGLLQPSVRTVFEFRHESWFEEDVFDLLHEHQVALCIAQAEDSVKVPVVSTADWGYLRLRMPKYSDVDLKGWIKKIRGQTWKEVFVFFKHEEEATGPKFAANFLNLIK